MKKHWLALRYLVIHKWYVLLAGIRLRVWWHQLILHDWTKLLPCEWFAYATHFHARDSEKKGSFERAWHHHLCWNKHHWQYWVLNRDDGRKPQAVEMPDRFVREMVADWVGAGKALGADDALGWYWSRVNHIILHPNTRKRVEELLNEYQSYSDSRGSA